MKKYITKIGAIIVILTLLFWTFPVQAGVLTSMEDTMTRLKVSTTADHAIQLILPAGEDWDGTTNDDDLIVRFPAGFAVGGTWATTDFAAEDADADPTITAVNAATTLTFPTCTGGSDDVVVAIDTDDADFGFRRCTGGSATGDTIVLRIYGTAGGGTLANPSSAGTYVINLEHDDEGVDNDNTGSLAVAIVTDEQVSITATVDPSLTFDLDVGPSIPTNSDPPYSVNLGTLTTGAVATSGVNNVYYIGVDLSTNAGGGAVITVLDAYTGLRSVTANKTIASETITLVAGTTERYGICVTTSGLAGLTRVAPFASTCTTTDHNVGGLTTSAQSILNSGGNPVANGRAEILVKAAIISTTPAATDYADAYTFIATSTF